MHIRLDLEVVPVSWLLGLSILLVKYMDPLVPACHNRRVADRGLESAERQMSQRVQVLML